MRSDISRFALRTIFRFVDSNSYNTSDCLYSSHEAENTVSCAGFSDIKVEGLEGNIKYHEYILSIVLAHVTFHIRKVFCINSI
jgi:hypothetical protein